MVYGGKYGSVVLWFLFLILPLTYVTSISDILLIFVISLLGLGGLIVNMYNRSIPKPFHAYTERIDKKIIIAFLLYFVWMIFMLMFSSMSFATFTRFIQMIGCMAAFMFGAYVGWKEYQFEKLQAGLKILIYVNFVAWLTSGMAFTNYSCIISNSNSYASMLYCWAVFLAIGGKKAKKNYLSMSICYFLIFCSSARGTLLASTVFVGLLIIYSNFPSNIISRKKLQLLFWMVVIALTLFVFIYPQLRGTLLGEKLTYLSRTYFNKNFFSGRQIIWSNMIDFIKERPLTGYGLNIIPSDLFSTRFSAHNTFLQLTLQSGLIGLVLLINIIKKIYNVLLEHCESRCCMIGAIFIVSLLVQECFEACLIQNMLVCGLEMWFMLGISCNKSLMSTDFGNKSKCFR